MSNVITRLMSHVSCPTRPARLVACLTALVAGAASGAVTAPAVPQPPVVTYGLVRDEFGAPLADDARALARLVKEGGGDTVYAQGVIAANVYRGMNYRLSLEIDSKGPVRSRAVTVGAPMRVEVLVDEAEQPLTPNPNWATPKAGTPQRKDYTIGEDSDGDGLPDAWELWMMELNLDWSDLDKSDAELLAAFRPGDDADGDGISNLAEFLAGTDPFLETDLFGISAFERVPGTEIAAITFPTIRGRTYHVLMSETAGGGWTPVATAAAPDAAFGYMAFDGTGRALTVYVDASLATAFFKVACY